MAFAHWRKCDFQVHTPRDPNWMGERPIGLGEVIAATGAKAAAQDVDAARATWAKEFVDQCINEALEAVALTDHHEMIMVPYVQEEIANRKAADPAFDLWLLPGMELTANGGRQCLIIFDADLSEDWRRQAQGKLGIVYADLEEKSAKGPRVTQLTCNYADIGGLLDSLGDGLKGRYIVLPNVSQGNSHTVLKDGAHADFRRMPYVGGFLDTGQSIKTLSAKNLRRLSGEEGAWSVREIYPLPTSDSRKADFASLGQNNTWIKLAAPTAEAIRQAFLGHRSRISIEEPQVPPLVVASIEVEGSAILQQTSLPLSPEFNAVIGGRGSGKSSFLEYISFGLGRSCYDAPREHYSGTQRLHDLTNDTLVSKGGRVTLTVVQDKAAFKIVRSQASAFQPQITYPNGSTQTITVKELRALFPAVVYSQGELAEIGKQAGKKTQLADLLQFVNPDYKREDDRLALDIESAKNKVRTAIQGLAENWAQQAKLRKMTTTRDSVRQRVEALEKTLPALSDDDQAIVDRFDKANEFESKRILASQHADEILEDQKAAAAELLNERDLTGDAEGTDAIRQEYAALYRSFSEGIARLQKEIEGKRAALKKAEEAWSAGFKEARVARDGVLEKLGAHKTVTSQIIKLREEITDLTNQIGALEAKLKADGDPAAGLTQALADLRKIHDQRAARTRQWASEIETLSSGKIKAAVDIAGDTTEIKDAIDLVAAKTGSQDSTRTSALADALASGSIWDVLDRLRTDCLSLLYWRQMGAASGEQQPACPDLMTVLGDTERIKTALTERIDTARVDAIATAVPRPQITLSYCDRTRQISFEKASEGQRAAALLFMLLEQPGGPLIIDQPEGDLDNKIIADLTDKLHSAKQNRQLIFASHNANIVVNGSSELVGYLDVKETGERQFECAGAIDTPSICKVITSTMEGGERAFKDRHDKYGY